MAIMRMPLNPDKQGSKIIFRSGQTIVGLGYDCLEEYMFWTDISGRTISRAKIDGSDSQVIVERGNSDTHYMGFGHGNVVEEVEKRNGVRVKGRRYREE